MWSNNGGESWKQGKINQLFRGTQNIRVAMFDQLVVDSQKWQARSYTGGAHVIYEGSIWKNGWWAEPTDIPGFANVWQKVKDLPNPIATFDFTKFNGEEADKYQREEAERIQNEKKVIGYFSNWHGYKTDYQPQNPDYSTSNGVINGKGYDPEDVPFDKISHVNYAFMIIDNEGNLKSNDPWADYEADGAKNYINQIVQKAEENDVVAMVSIGGWTNSVDDRGFDHATATPERMNRFTDQLVEFMLKYEFDGIDIDWEYPENNEEKTKFVALLKQLREKMIRAGKEDDQYYQLSIAVTANHQKMEFIAPKIVNEYVDSFNVMTYDFRGGFDSETGHHAPLYSTSTDKDKKFNVSSAMEEYHKVFGIPKNKLMVGMSYYSRGFANVSKAGIGIPSKGTPNGGSWDDPAQLAGLKPWWQLKDYEKQAKDENVKHLSYYWDKEAQAPYIYDAQKKELYTYDNIESISKKVNYTIDNGYGGAIIWELAHDTPETDELGSLVANILTGDKVDEGEHEEVDQTSIKTKDVTLYVGEKWQDDLGFVSAVDKDGKEVAWSSGKIKLDKSNLDLNKVGEYQLTYTFNDKKAAFKVTIKEDKSTIKTKNVTLYVGEKWDRKLPFVSATDEDGKSVPWESNKITSNNTNVDTSKPGYYKFKYTYKGRVRNVDSEFTVTVKANQSVLKTKNVTLYMGEKWDDSLGFVSAVDKDGKEVPWSSGKIKLDKSNLDLNKAGEYQLTYTLNDKEVAFKVTIKEDKSTIKTKNVTLYVGEKWDRKLPFVSATDEDGKSVPWESNKITSNNTNVDTSKPGYYKFKYTYKGKVRNVDSEFTVTVKAKEAPNQAILYEKSNGDASGWTIKHPNLSSNSEIVENDLTNVGKANALSSVSLPPKMAITLYEGRYQEKRAVTIINDTKQTKVYNLSGINFDSTTVSSDNKIMSYQIYSLESKVVLYEHANKKGFAIISSHIRNLASLAKDNRVSSVSLPAGKSITLYNNKDFGGRAITLTNDSNQVKEYRLGAYQFNDMVSSYHAYSLKDDVVLYENTDQITTGFAHEAGNPYVLKNLADFGRDNQVSAVSLPAGKSVTLYEHKNYGGRSLTLTNTTNQPKKYSLGDQYKFNDIASSYRVHTQENSIILYEHANLTGFSIILSANSHNFDLDLSKQKDRNDRISAVSLPPGRGIVLYEDHYWLGRSLTLQNDTKNVQVYELTGKYNFNDITSSYLTFYNN
ncbi:bacterial Ig-like domain-containing protein [Enterococcus faecalis]|nr:bacterial Ig-like domain-containing protein [Enterococcus faecalis]